MLSFFKTPWVSIKVSNTLKRRRTVYPIIDSEEYDRNLADKSVIIMLKNHQLLLSFVISNNIALFAIQLHAYFSSFMFGGVCDLEAIPFT